MVRPISLLNDPQHEIMYLMTWPSKDDISACIAAWSCVEVLRPCQPNGAMSNVVAAWSDQTLLDIL